MNTSKIVNLAHALHDVQKELDEIVLKNYGSYAKLDEAREEMANSHPNDKAFQHARNRMDVYLAQRRPVMAQFTAIKNALKRELEFED